MNFTDDEYYERLHLLLERVVLVYCKRLFNNYLESKYLTLFTFLDRNKHRIMHCVRHDSYCCFQNKYKCVLNNAQTFTEYAWSKIYMDVPTRKCVKQGCVCHVLTKSKRMPKLDIEILTFFLREFNIVDFRKFTAVTDLEKFFRFMNNLEYKRVQKDDYDRWWTKIVNSLQFLGMDSSDLDEVRRLVPTPVPVKKVQCTFYYRYLKMNQNHNNKRRETLTSTIQKIFC